MTGVAVTVCDRCPDLREGATAGDALCVRQTTPHRRRQRAVPQGDPDVGGWADGPVTERCEYRVCRGGSPSAAGPDDCLRRQIVYLKCRVGRVAATRRSRHSGAGTAQAPPVAGWPEEREGRQRRSVPAASLAIRPPACPKHRPTPAGCALQRNVYVNKGSDKAHRVPAHLAQEVSSAAGLALGARPRRATLAAWVPVLRARTCALRPLWRPRPPLATTWFIPSSSLSSFTSASSPSPAMSKASSRPCTRRRHSLAQQHASRRQRPPVQLVQGSSSSPSQRTFMPIFSMTL